MWTNYQVHNFIVIFKFENNFANATLMLLIKSLSTLEQIISAIYVFDNRNNWKYNNFCLLKTTKQILCDFEAIIPNIAA